MAKLGECPKHKGKYDPNCSLCWEAFDKWCNKQKWYITGDTPWGAGVNR